MATGASPLLRVITRLNVGGPARQALLLTRSLADDFPTLLAAGVPTSAEGELTDPEVSVHRVPLVRPIQPIVDAAAVRAVRRLIIGHRARLVHTHMAKAGAVGRMAARSLTDRPRTVHTFHGHVLEGYFRPGTERVFIELERRLARCTDVLVAVSPEIRDALLDLRIGRSSQFCVIPLGLDLEPYLAVDRPTGIFRASLGLGQDVPLVGVIGRLVPIKNHVMLLRALEELEEVHLAIVGDGELRQALEEQVRAAGLANRVHFTGWRLDLATVLGDLDVVALTSLNEGTPVALIEALAAQCAVVATDVGGVRSVIVDRRTGLLVSAGDHGTLARALKELIHAPALRLALGIAGRKHVHTRFGQQRLISDVRDLYNDLVVR